MKMKQILILILIGAVQISHCFYYNDTPFIDNMKSNNVHFRNYYHPLFNQTIDFIKLLSKNDEINLDCKVSLERWINGIQMNELWALKFLEATGKLFK